MRRSLILTVAAVVSMVLLAMLVPMAALLRSYALEDRVSRAALEAQATETVVAGEDRGAVSTYLDRVNRRPESTTTVLYPPTTDDPDGDAIGPTPGESAAVADARRTGRASIEDRGGGVELLIPVSLGTGSGSASAGPVVRVVVHPPGLESGIVRSWLVLAGLGVVLLVAALVLADRIGRSFVQPVLRLAEYATALGQRRSPEPVAASGPAEVRELATAMNLLVGRIDSLLERERAVVADLSHRLRTPVTALRLRVEGLTDVAERDRLSADLDDLQATVDHVVREARRTEREGRVAHSDAGSVIAERVGFWRPLAEDQGRPFEVRVLTAGALPVRAAEEDLVALVDVLLDNAFSHTPEDAAVLVTLGTGPAGGAELRVEDGGPGFPDDLDPTGRGATGAGSTGLGLAIAERTAIESGGALTLGVSTLGGSQVAVVLGPPG